MTSRTLAVLAFHKIGEPSDPVWQTWNYVPTAQFRAMLDILDEDGWTVIDLSLFRRALDDPLLMPERAALITFDDGYRSTHTEALPCLKAKGYPAVVFVPTSFVGGTNRFDLDIEPTEEMCSWDELRRLNEEGIAVQAHSESHPQLSELDEAKLTTELGRSRRDLEERLGRTVDMLAYPYGNAAHPSLTAGFLSDLGYRAAFLYGGGTTGFPLPDRYRIARVALGLDSDLRVMLAAGGEAPK